MRLLLVALLIVGAVANSDQLWNQWKRKFGKEYNDLTEEARRRAQFESNVEVIKNHNLRHDLGLVTYTLGLNQFTDMSFEEFKAQYLSPMPVDAADLVNIEPYEPTNEDVPESVDWREKGYVTSVKNQGNCGSCWAFSTVGTVEGQYMRKYGELKEFSQQQLVDCSQENNGCNGGLMERAYHYLSSHGLEEESVYPYHAREQRCAYDASKGVVKVSGYRGVHTGNEDSLKKLIGQQGPAAVAIDVERDFMMYRSGVYQSKQCSPRALNHGVLAVGYGTEAEVPYWIVKNSWGPDWGDHGYIRMRRNNGNMCGIATLASVPSVVKA